MQYMIQELFSKERTGPSTLKSSDGAAVLGSILTGESSSQLQDLLLLDVTHLPMSLEEYWWRDDQVHRA